MDPEFWKFASVIGVVVGGIIGGWAASRFKCLNRPISELWGRKKANTDTSSRSKD